MNYHFGKSSYNASANGIEVAKQCKKKHGTLQVQVMHGKLNIDVKIFAMPSYYLDCLILL